MGERLLTKAVGLSGKGLPLTIEQLWGHNILTAVVCVVVFWIDRDIADNRYLHSHYVHRV